MLGGACPWPRPPPFWDSLPQIPLTVGKDVCPRMFLVDGQYRRAPTRLSAGDLLNALWENPSDSSQCRKDEIASVC